MEDISIKFVRNYIPSSGTVPVNDAVISSSGDLSQTTQTYDFSAWILLGIAFLAIAIAIIYIYVYKTKRNLASGAHVSRSSLSCFQVFNIDLSAKVAFVLSVLVACCCILFGAFGMNAKYANADGPFILNKNVVIAMVDENGSITIDPCSISNISSYKYTVFDSSFLLTNESKNIEGIDSASITVNGFGGKLFEGNPSTTTQKQTTSGLTPLLSNGTTSLTFNIDIKDQAIIEALIDKVAFKFSITPKIVIPTHEKFKDYTWPELKEVANAISDGVLPVSEMTKIKEFAEQGETIKVDYTLDGNPDALEFRIIGIKHDDVAGSPGKKAGLTLMAVNSINKGYITGNPDSTPGNYYAAGWHVSDFRKKMQPEGEIYEMIIKGMNGITPTPVVKKTRGGWDIDNGAGSRAQDNELYFTEDYFFLPSDEELGAVHPDWENLHEGSKYEYIKNDGFPEVWRNDDTQSAGMLNCLNYNGFILAKGKTDSTSLDEVYFDSDIMSIGAVTDIDASFAGNGSCSERTSGAAANTQMMCFSYSGAPFQEFNSGLKTCIAPCFCL